MADFDITRIAGNIGAMNALNSLQNINKQLSVHQTRLSTGKRINSAADDPAGLTIATKMDSRSQGLKTALDNIGDAKNLLAVAESGMGRINDILVQMQNKAESAASDTMGTSERSAIVTQLQAYAAQIDDISSQTEWNGTKLIDGHSNTALEFQTGAGKDDVTSVAALSNMGASSVGSLQLAAKVDGVTTISEATNNVVKDGTAVAGSIANENLTALVNGDYTVQVVYGGTLGSASEVHLFDADGNEMSISQDGTDATSSVAKGITGLDLSDATGGDEVLDFGNGLQVTVAQLAGGDVNHTATDAVSFATSGDTYKIQFDDGSGPVTFNKRFFRC